MSRHHYTPAQLRGMARAVIADYPGWRAVRLIGRLAALTGTPTALVLTWIRQAAQ